MCRWRPRPPRTGQKQSNHTFLVSGSRGYVCLSGGSRKCVVRLKPYGQDLRLGSRKRGGGATPLNDTKTLGFHNITFLIIKVEGDSRET